MIPAAELDDDRLVDLYHRAREWGLRRGGQRRRPRHRRSALAPVPVRDRPAAASTAAWRSTRPGGTTAPRPRSGSAAAARPSRSKPTPRTLDWELTELQVSTILDGPEVWVPTIVVLLERYRGNQDATSAVLYRLVQMGLVQPVVDPNRPGQVLLDTGILDRLIAAVRPAGHHRRRRARRRRRPRRDLDPRGRPRRRGDLDARLRGRRRPGSRPGAVPADPARAVIATLRP